MRAHHSISNLQAKSQTYSCHAFARSIRYRALTRSSATHAGKAAWALCVHKDIHAIAKSHQQGHDQVAHAQPTNGTTADDSPASFARIIEDFLARHPTTLAVRGMPEECLFKLAVAVHFETFDKGNAAAELHLNGIRVKRFPSVDAYIRRGDAKRAMGDPVGALVDWAAAFEIKSIAEKLFCLSQMMSLANHWRSCDEVSRPGLELERAARDDKYADVWAEVAVRPLEVMGQTMQIQDLSTVSAAAVLQFYLAEVQICLAVVINCDDDSWEHKWSIQRTDRCSFKFSQLSYNKQLLQQAACKLYLNESTDALDDLNEAVRDYSVYPSDYASDYALAYQYRAAAHQALGNDVAAAEDLASAEHLTPHPDFVVINNHSAPEDGMAMNDVISGDKRQVYMAATACKILAQHR